MDCFKYFDWEGSGSILFSMLCYVLILLGEKFIDEEFDVLLLGYVSLKGEISYEVFIFVIMVNVEW